VDTIHCTGLRCAPAEDRLGQYIINFLLPKLHAQPQLLLIRRLFFKYFPKALLEVGRVVILSFGKSMQRPHACLSKSFSVLICIDAIQQNHYGIVGPDSNTLRGPFRAHGKQPQCQTGEDRSDCGFLMK
jgi:hypothetical protein